jgi:Fe-S cluster assembly scaffold protein SufB
MAEETHLGEKKRRGTAVAEPKREVFERDYSRYDFSYSTEHYTFIGKPGLRREVVEEISRIKGEPEWMRKFRLEAYEVFVKKPLPTWGADLTTIDFDKIVYYARPTDQPARSWDDVPEEIKKTFDRLGIPEAERKFLAGVGAQYDSETVYHNLREELRKKGVIFLGMDEGLKEYPEIVKEYFGTVIPKEDNKFAALNSAVWSGGSFVYVPKGVHVEIPLQAYFRINAASMGQFERTLIIAEEGSKVHYIEGCTAPVYSRESLHSAVVELIAKPGAHLRYTTLQNWSNDVYNLVTKRAVAYEGATVEWVDANIGCLAGDTKVLLNSDIKPIAEVEPGDQVFTLNPQFELEPRRVVAKKYSGRRPVFRLVTETHREIVATANHPFFSLRKEGRSNVIAWRRLDELKEGDWVAITGQVPDCGEPLRLQVPDVKGIRNKIRAPEETNEELMWLLGFYLGDGFCERNRVNIAVVPEDPAFPRVVRALQELFGVEPKLYQGKVLRIASAQLARFIQELGFGGKASEKRVPAWVYRLPQSQRRAFLEGYIAADGHVRPGHRNLSVTSSHRALLEDIRDLAISCGLNPLKISEWRRVEKKPLGREEKEYRHYFLYFADWRISAPTAFVRISRIEPAGEADTWDIEIEGTHNFVANGFIVHNSRVTMKYPSVYLMGKGAKAEILSVAYAGKGQHQDTGGKVIHAAPYTTSTVTSKSVSKDGGRTSYRGLLKVARGAVGSKATVLCDALLLDEHSRSDTYPYIEIDEDQVTVGHEATVGKVGEDQIFYLMSRGLSEAEALAMIVLGFMEPFTKTLPMEYAIEFNRLIQLEMEGSVG